MLRIPDLQLYQHAFTAWDKQEMYLRYQNPFGLAKQTQLSIAKGSMLYTRRAEVF